MLQPGFFDLDERYARLNERDPLVKLKETLIKSEFPAIQGYVAKIIDVSQ